MAVAVVGTAGVVLTARACDTWLTQAAATPHVAVPVRTADVSIAGRCIAEIRDLLSLAVRACVSSHTLSQLLARSAGKRLQPMCVPDSQGGVAFVQRREARVALAKARDLRVLALRLIHDCRFMSRTGTAQAVGDVARVRGAAGAAEPDELRLTAGLCDDRWRDRSAECGLVSAPAAGGSAVLFGAEGAIDTVGTAALVGTARRIPTRSNQCLVAECIPGTGGSYTHIYRIHAAAYYLSNHHIEACQLTVTECSWQRNRSTQASSHSSPQSRLDCHRYSLRPSEHQCSV
jgi:hypothetical protein